MNIDKLTQADRAGLVTCLSIAFYDYPVMRFILRDSGKHYDEHLAALIGFFCDIRLICKAPVLGIRSDSQIVAAALINEPSRGPLPLPPAELERLRSVLGEQAYDRLVRFETKSSEPEPAAPHHYLGMIGVHPARRGERLAGALLQSVKEMAIADPESIGVCLTTENSANLPFYEHFGYRVIGEVDIEDLHSWCLFLPVQEERSRTARL